MRLYAKQGQPRAALKLASVDERLKGQPQPSSQQLAANSDEAARIEKAKSRFNSLSARSSLRERQSRIELLALLSASAERIGSFEKAMDFERARLNLPLSAAEQRKTESRIEELKVKQQARSRKPALPLEINDSLITLR